MWRVTSLLTAAAVGCGVGGPAEIGGDGDGDGDGDLVESVNCEAIYDRPGHGETFYEDNPTYIDDRELAWEVDSPGALGIDQVALEAAADQLAASPALLSLLVVRGETLVFERYYNGSAADHSNNVHSASKSVLSTLVGIAIDDGLLALDTPLAEVLPGHASDLRLEVGHLLTMSSGRAWTEDETEYEIEGAGDWIAAIIDRPITGQPGIDFNYSTGDSHLMSAALASAVGESTCAFAHDRLFGPLGITAEHWGRDPTGVYSGGYNLYLTPRELLRFGLLIANRGAADGRQLVAADWIDRSIASRMNAGDGYGYGYYFWLRNLGGRDVAIASGYGGQFVYLVPELDLIVAMTADTAGEHAELDGSAFVTALIAATSP